MCDKESNRVGVVEMLPRTGILTLGARMTRAVLQGLEQCITLMRARPMLRQWLLLVKKKKRAFDLAGSKLQAAARPMRMYALCRSRHHPVSNPFPPPSLPCRVRCPCRPPRQVAKRAPSPCADHVVALN